MAPASSPFGTDPPRKASATKRKTFPASPSSPSKIRNPPAPAIVICPGGAYEFLAWDHEGVNEARWFQQRGISAFVLKYRLPKDGYLHPVPLLDAQRAIRLVRHNAEEWNLDASQIGLMGFSAGGHLAATVNTHFDTGQRTAIDPIDRESCRPDFTVLVYPVISTSHPHTHAGSMANLLGPDPDPAVVDRLSADKNVTNTTPPTLLVHAQDDGPVPIENSRLMLAALQEAGVLSMIHEYPTGGHGFGYHHDQPNRVEGWLERAHEWLRKSGLLP